MDQLIALNTTRGEDHESRIRKLESEGCGGKCDVRLQDLEKRKFPLPTIAVLIALASVALNAIQYISK